jgi:dihydrofolate synthase/folylpolyglutamate synthase
MGYKVGEEALRRGLEDARWPGRLEVMSSDPYVILDGAHNPTAVKALAATMGELFPDTRPTLVFGAMEDKDLSGMLAALLPTVKRVVLTRPSMKRSAETALLRELTLPYGVDAAAAETVPLALKGALEGASREDVILVTGSLFTVGEARTCLGNTACG